MRFRARRRGSRDAAVIDLTSLIDVVFLLLIFLLVTTTFKSEQLAFTIELPSSSVKQVTVTTDKTTVFVTRSGDLHLLTVAADSSGSAADFSKARKVSREELREALKRIYQRRPDAPIAIRGEKSASYQSMIEVVGTVQDVGFRQVWFPYKRPDGGDASP